MSKWAVIINSMTYTSFFYYALLAVVILLYYIVPGRIKWTVLLAGSMVFYWFLVKSPVMMGAFLAMILISYVFGILIRKTGSKAVLTAGIILSAAPLALSKALEITATSILHAERGGIVLPVGASFFTLQMIAYLVDVYKKEIKAQRNLLKYALYISFFPHIIQGPIPRYDQLAKQLYTPHKFCEQNIVEGFYMILWGFFLKYMIADKAGVIVDTVFYNPETYKGMYALTAGCLYSIQLYTDFMSCVYLSRGAAKTMGIDVISNFEQPYFATSIKDFWRRWHISLSSWLRDYIYIPLGGSRNGKLRKYVNLVVVFLVSGIWHGGSFRFIFWGLLHAFYQIAGEVTYKARDRLYAFAGIEKDSYLRHIIKSIGTFFLVMIAWIIFRAPSLKTGLKMILSIFTVRNYWIFWNDTLFTLGLGWKEWGVLMQSIVCLFVISYFKTKISVSGWLMRQHLIVRWTLCIGAILIIMTFGTYGVGYDAKAFIYGGF